jgi:DNA-binding GntR family transcriptional regulator
MSAPLGKIGGSSRRELVAEAIREAIFSGELRPGDRLVELDLAAQLGTSRAPIREALRQLELEGLVVSFPYRGTEVLGTSQEAIEQVLVPIRVVVETFAFTKALAYLTESDFEELERLVRRMETAAARHDAADLSEADIRFHEFVVERSEQQHCLQIWRTVQPRVRSYFRRDAFNEEHSRGVPAQHQTLIDALRSKNPALVRSAVVEHIQTFIHEEDEPTHQDAARL